MSYSFELEVTDGEITAKVSEGMKQYLPDGKFFIGGHEDSNARSINISRIRPDGTVAVQTNCGTSGPRNEA